MVHAWVSGWFQKSFVCPLKLLIQPWLACAWSHMSSIPLLLFHHLLLDFVFKFWIFQGKTFGIYWNISTWCLTLGSIGLFSHELHLALLWVYLIIPCLIFGFKFWILQGTTAGDSFIETLRHLSLDCLLTWGGMNSKSIVDGAAQKVA
jgi:hypothetical protein